MVKRLFFTAVGLGAGVALGVYAVRKMEATRRRMQPDALAASAGARVESLGSRMRDAVAEGRAAAAAREAELRATYRVGQPRRSAPGDLPGGGPAPATGAGPTPGTAGGPAGDGGGLGVADWVSPPADPK